MPSRGRPGPSTKPSHCPACSQSRDFAFTFSRSPWLRSGRGFALRAGSAPHHWGIYLCPRVNRPQPRARRSLVRPLAQTSCFGLCLPRGRSWRLSSRVQFTSRTESPAKFFVCVVYHAFSTLALNFWFLASPLSPRNHFQVCVTDTVFFVWQIGVVGRNGLSTYSTPRNHFQVCVTDTVFFVWQIGVVGSNGLSTYCSIILASRSTRKSRRHHHLVEEVFEASSRRTACTACGRPLRKRDASAHHEKRQGRRQN